MSQVWSMKLTASTNFFILVIELPVQLKRILKKPSWKIMVSRKCLSGEWTAVRE